MSIFLDPVSQSATHLPVLLALSDVLLTRNIFELGSGLFSTAAFSTYADRLISIESDLQWFEAIKHAHADNSRIEIRYHEIPNGVAKKSLEEYDQGTINQVRSYYDGLRSGVSGFDLLFVDQYLAFRTISLISLYDAFPIVVWHDAQSKKYRYDTFYQQNLSDYARYAFKFMKIETGFLIKKNMLFRESELFDRIHYHCGVFTQQHCDLFQFLPKTKLKRV